MGGRGAISGPPAGDANQRSATAMPGRAERLGVWGPFRGPQQATRTRGAPRLCRGAPNVWGLGAISGPPAGDANQRSATAIPGRAERLGFGGHFGAPSRRREPEERHGYAGARRTLGGLGAISGPPAGDASQRSATAMPGRAERLGFGGHFGAPIYKTRSRDRWPGSPPRRAVTDDGAPGRHERWEVWGAVAPRLTTPGDWCRCRCRCSESWPRSRG